MHTVLPKGAEIKNFLLTLVFVSISRGIVHCLCIFPETVNKYTSTHVCWGCVYIPLFHFKNLIAAKVNFKCIKGLKSFEKWNLILIIQSWKTYGRFLFSMGLSKVIKGRMEKFDCIEVQNTIFLKWFRSWDLTIGQTCSSSFVLWQQLHLQCLR